MKNNIYSLILLLTATLFVACKKDKIKYQGDFERSYQTWQEFKRASGDSYRYKIVSGSWTGYSSEMTVTVNNGKIVHRSYVGKELTYSGPNATPVNEVKVQWEEDEATLNTHPGIRSMTLDEIYQQAREEWLAKKDNVTTYFEANNNGMISKCGYVPDNCIDDCFMGISIASIEKIQ